MNIAYPSQKMSLFQDKNVTDFLEKVEQDSDYKLDDFRDFSIYLATQTNPAIFGGKQELKSIFFVQHVV